MNTYKILSRTGSGTYTQTIKAHDFYAREGFLYFIIRGRDSWNEEVITIIGLNSLISINIETEVKE